MFLDPSANVSECVLSDIMPPGRVRLAANQMQDFYRLREAKSDTTKAEALRQAQLRLLYGESATEAAATKASTSDRQIVHDQIPDATSKPRFMSDPKKPYSHPYHWAPFILMGNWK